MPDYPLVYAQHISPPDADGWRTMRLFLVESSYLYDVECVGICVKGAWEFDTIELKKMWSPLAFWWPEEPVAEWDEAIKSLGQAISDELNEQAVAAAERQAER